MILEGPVTNFSHPSGVFGSRGSRVRGIIAVGGRKFSSNRLDGKDKQNSIQRIVDSLYKITDAVSRENS